MGIYNKIVIFQWVGTGREGEGEGGRSRAQTTQSDTLVMCVFLLAKSGGKLTLLGKSYNECPEMY
jgi:hypothetical protein